LAIHLCCAKQVKPLSANHDKVKIGHLRRGTSGSIIIIPPEKMLADPRPAMARLIMKVVELGAAPQSADPAAKITIETKNTYFVV
jgi:hypothetical protein